MLFVLTDQTERFKSKNIIDTAVYRGGDAISGWLYTMIQEIGKSMSAIGIASIPLGLAWLWSGSRMANELKSKTKSEHYEISITKRSA